jgi:hypothetical protein
LSTAIITRLKGGSTRTPGLPSTPPAAAKAAAAAAVWLFMNGLAFIEVLLPPEAERQQRIVKSLNYGHLVALINSNLAVKTTPIPYISCERFQVPHFTFCHGYTTITVAISATGGRGLQEDQPQTT